MSNRETVTSVISLKISREQKDQLLILASGQVPTPGWTDPALEPYVYIQPPPDGIYDFTFVATPPSGPVPQVLSTISVKDQIPLTPDLKGVRVHGATNSMEALLDA